LEQAHNFLAFASSIVAFPMLALEFRSLPFGGELASNPTIVLVALICVAVALFNNKQASETARSIIPAVSCKFFLICFMKISWTTFKFFLKKKFIIVLVATYFSHNAYIAIGSIIVVVFGIAIGASFDTLVVMKRVDLFHYGMAVAQIYFLWGLTKSWELKSILP
jgi:hypothetical protein